MKNAARKKAVCPNCGSADVVLAPRGTSFWRRWLLGDFADIDSQDLWYTCVECNHRWEKNGAEGIAICPKCNNQIFSEERKCSNCGEKVEN